MSHDFVVTNNDGNPIEEAFVILQNADIKINLDIKETKSLDNLYNLLVKYNLVERSF